MKGTKIANPILMVNPGIAPIIIPRIVPARMKRSDCHTSMRAIPSAKFSSIIHLVSGAVEENPTGSVVILAAITPGTNE